MTALHVRRMTEGGTVSSCHAGRVDTDGPWLIVYAAAEQLAPELIVPAHAVVAVTPCDGSCDAEG